VGEEDCHCRVAVSIEPLCSDARFGSQATDLTWSLDVRFSPNSDQIAAPHQVMLWTDSVEKVRFFEECNFFERAGAFVRILYGAPHD
jgi:hypothetical protein